MSKLEANLILLGLTWGWAILMIGPAYLWNRAKHWYWRKYGMSTLTRLWRKSLFESMIEKE